MPKRKKSKRVKKPPVRPVVNKKVIGEAPDLEAFIVEANEVRGITNTPGWAILERDFTNYRNTIMSKIAYLDPSKPEQREACILFIAIDKLLSLVNDYQTNRDKAIALINKLENKDLTITMDIDNE